MTNSANADIATRAGRKAVYPVPLKYTPGDAMEKFVAIKGEEALVRRMVADGLIAKKNRRLPRVLTATPKGHRPSPAVLRKRAKLLKCIAKFGPMSQVEMITATGFDKSFVSKTVITLTEAGTIEETDDGKRAWRIASAQPKTPTHDTEQEHG